MAELLDDPFDFGDESEKAAERETRAAMRQAGIESGTQKGFKAFGKRTIGTLEGTMRDYAEHGDPERYGLAPKRQKPINHNPRTKVYLYNKYPGSNVQYSEQHVVTRSGFMVKKDYLGFIDFLVFPAVNAPAIAIQATTLKGKSSHIVKMSKLEDCWKWIRDGKPLMLLLWTDEPDTKHEWQKVRGNSKFYCTEVWITEEILKTTYNRRKKLQSTRASKVKRR